MGRRRQREASTTGPQPWDERGPHRDGGSGWVHPHVGRSARITRAGRSPRFSGRGRCAVGRGRSWWTGHRREAKSRCFVTLRGPPSQCRPRRGGWALFLPLCGSWRAHPPGASESRVSPRAICRDSAPSLRRPTRAPRGPPPTGALQRTLRFAEVDQRPARTRSAAKRDADAQPPTPPERPPKAERPALGGPFVCFWEEVHLRGTFAGRSICALPQGVLKLPEGLAQGVSGDRPAPRAAVRGGAGFPAPPLWPHHGGLRPNEPATCE
ncbi:MAG: hypothetical protein QOI62_1768 [Solirubrobacteraceae bacterium]|jgi:hypothetical protein|nr:hypothetical protein [Solirubrobacteraceae bacterium]